MPVDVVALALRIECRDEKKKKCERVKSNLTRDKRKSCYSFKFCADHTTPDVL